MSKACLSSAIFIMLSVFALWSSSSFAATDGIYNLAQVGTAWDGTDANRLEAPSANYDHTYGDEASLSYTLPWTFTFYGQAYSQINADTNGNIWFTSIGSASSFTLPNAGRGPVISAWNNDLSSYYYTGTFIQHKTNPERVVVEWQTETYTDEGFSRPSDFEVVLFQNGDVRFDYNSFNSSTQKDFGSGISKDDNLHYLNLSATYGNAYNQAGHSYGFASASIPAVSVDPPPSSVGQSSYTVTGAMQVGSTVTITSSGGATIGPVVYTSPTTWSCVVSNLTSGNNVFTVTATSPSGQITPTDITVNYTAGGAAPVPALTKPVFFTLAAALCLVMLFANGRSARKEKEC